MGGKKRILCLTALFLVFSMLCPMVVTGAAAEPNKSPPTLDTWQPPKDFVDPVTLKIQEFRAQGLKDRQIATELEKLGMGWYPKTGATWVGKTLTPEELAEMPITAPAKTPSDEGAALRTVSRTSCMRTSSAAWRGVASEMVSGSMSVTSQGTRYSYLCVQLGSLDSGSNWVEAVLTHNYGETYKWYTYDNDEGGWSYYRTKNTATTCADSYVIMMDGTHDGSGYNYDIWINFQWIRSGHLSSLYAQAGFQKEVYSDSGQFTNDVSHAVFYRNWLRTSQDWMYWVSAVNSWWSTSYPIRATHYMAGSSYLWETWVQN